MNNRLTKRIGKYVYYNDNGKEVLAAEIMNDEINGIFKLKELLMKLADYEDIGYGPDEIKEKLKTLKNKEKENISDKLDENICYEVIVEGIKYQKIIDKLNSKILELTEDKENEDKKSI